MRKGNIWTVRPGQAPKQLTHRGGSSPSWAPDGRYLAFVRKNRIFIVRRDGRHLRRFLSREASTPVWSPSGRLLAFTSNYDLYVARADGKKLRRLLNYDAPLLPAG
jgi:Tol biopolymer transport system component